METRISVIIPVFNGIAFLQEAIKSVFQQRYRDWQLVLIDDFSSDGSRSVIDSLADPRVVRFYNDKNQGLYSTLAELVPELSAEWIAILMQDDRYKPDYLQEMSLLIERHPEVPAFWACEDTIDQCGNLITRGQDTGRVERIEAGTHSWLGVLRRGCIWTISGSLTRRHLFTALPFRTDLPHCGDYEWILRAIRQVPFVYYERTLTEVRIHSGQASAANLRTGRDIREQYVVIAQNLRNHSAEVSLRNAFGVCIQRALLILRRILGSLCRGNIRFAVGMSGYLWRFVKLPFIYRYGAEWRRRKC